MKICKTFILNNPPPGKNALLELPDLTYEVLQHYIGNDVTKDGLLKNLQFLANYGLLGNSKKCPNPGCETLCSLVQESYRKNIAYIWRCNHCRHSTGGGSHRIGIRKGSFFEASKLSMVKILRIIGKWSDIPEEPIVNVAKEVGCNKATVIEVYNNLRDLSERWFERNAFSEQVGGEGKIVELDELEIFRSRDNHGRQPKCSQFIFTAMERDSTNMTMMPVEQHGMESLLNFIKKFVAPGTLIMSDILSNYGGTYILGQKLQEENIKILDAADRASENGGSYGGIRKKLKSLYGTGQASYTSPLCQYFFRMWHKEKYIMNNVLLEIAREYTVGGE